MRACAHARALFLFTSIDTPSLWIGRINAVINTNKRHDTDITINGGHDIKHERRGGWKSESGRGVIVGQRGTEYTRNKERERRGVGGVALYLSSPGNVKSKYSRYYYYSHFRRQIYYQTGKSNQIGG